MSRQQRHNRRHKANSLTSVLSDETASLGTTYEDSNEFESGGWECTVCTYRNRSESFRCEMCEVRKGTSTRKPRLNSAVVEQQQTVQKFVQQQQLAMVAQANKEKSRDRTSLCGNSSVHDTDSPGPSHRSLESPLSCNSSAQVGCSSSCRLRSVSPSLSEGFVDAPPTPQLSCISPENVPTNQNGTTSACQLSPPILLPIINDEQRSPSSVRASPPSSPPLPTCSSTCIASTESLTADDATCINSISSISNKNGNECSTSGAIPSTTTAVSRGRKKGSLNGVQRKPPVTFFRKHVDQNSARTLAITVNGVTVVITDYKLINNPSESCSAISALNYNNVGGGNVQKNVNNTNANKLKRKLKEKEQNLTGFGNDTIFEPLATSVDRRHMDKDMNNN